MRKHTLDNKKVTCPNATYSGHWNRYVAKKGDMILYHDKTAPDATFAPVHLARVVGRIATCDSNGENCVGWLSVLVLSEDGYGLYVRWVEPVQVQAIFDPPTKIPAFFFGAKWPDAATLYAASEHGSLHERYIDNVVKLD